MASESVVVWQNKDYQTQFRAVNPEDEEFGEPEVVVNLHELTPYGMLLASIGSCTAILLNSYAQSRGIDLEVVEIHLEYRRSFAEDCKNCESEDDMIDTIHEQLRFEGNLSSAERKKLMVISERCPIHQMVAKGTPIHSELVTEA